MRIIRCAAIVIIFIMQNLFNYCSKEVLLYLCDSFKVDASKFEHVAYGLLFLFRKYMGNKSKNIDTIDIGFVLFSKILTDFRQLFRHF